jgi:small nuclear ribonucleoprotein F
LESHNSTQRLRKILPQTHNNHERTLSPPPFQTHPKPPTSQKTNTSSRKQFVPMNPRPMLQSLVDNDVRIRLKWGQTEYTGRLVSVDSYMNIQLSGAVEYIEGKNQGQLGQVLIRCNNVLWISANREGSNGDAEMAG